MRFPLRGLYAITQTENKTADTVINEVIAAIKGGAVVVHVGAVARSDAASVRSLVGAELVSGGHMLRRS